MTAPVPTEPQVPATQPPAPQVPPSPTPTFDQAAVDRIVAERLERERRKYEGYDELKAKAQKYDEIEAQNATELEKAVKTADAQARADMLDKTNSRLIRSEVKAAAAAAGFHNPGIAATQLASKFGDIKVSDDGDVDEEAVKALVEQLAKDEPYLVKPTTPSVPAFAPNPGQGQHQPTKPSGGEAGKAEAERRFGARKRAQS